MEGKTIGRFRLGKLHRQGGVSAVHHAEETLPSGARRDVAVKLIETPNTQDPRFIDAFIREAAIQQQFAELPGILEVIDFGQVDGQVVWIAMEFAPRCVGDLIGEHPTDPALVMKMLGQALVGLDHLHTFQKAPVLHRDLKPSNILIRGSDDEPRFAISDIELGGENVPPMPCSAARARYLAPEFCGSDTRHESPASDIYSLGMVAYHMLLGHERFELTPRVETRASKGPAADVGAWMQWHCSPGLIAPSAHELIPGVPRILSETIARMIAKPLDQRYSAALDVLRDLTSARVAPARRAEAFADPIRQAANRQWYGRWDIRIASAAVLSGAVSMCAWAWSRPEPILILDQSSSLAGYGKERLIRVRAEHMPEGSRVVVVPPNEAPHPMERVKGAPGALFESRIPINRAKSVSADVFIESSAGERIASRQIALERYAPLALVVVTTPPTPSMKLTVQGLAGTFELPEELTTDEKGVARLDLEPGEYEVSGTAGEFEVAGGAVKREVHDDDSGGIRWSIPLTPLTGTLVMKVEPTDATVLARSASGSERTISLYNGAGTLKPESGTWTLVAEAEGYITKSDTVVIRKGEKIERVWKLKETPKPMPPPAVPPPLAPEPTPASEIMRIAKQLVPLEQITFAAIPVGNQVRVSGSVFNQEESQLLSNRLQPIADRIVLEVRVDEESCVAKVRDALRAEGMRFVTSDIRSTNDRLVIRIPTRQEAADARARVVATVNRFFLVPEHASLQWYTY